MWVKVCGTTTAEDALLAVEAGADAVGFVLARVSRRQVGVMGVRGMVDRMLREGGRAAAVERVGVFDPADYLAEGGVGADGHVEGGAAGWRAEDLAGAIVADARAAGLTAVQLHGASAAMGVGLVELAVAVRAGAPEMGVLPVVSWAVGDEAAGERVREALEGLRGAGFGRVLVDSKVGAAMGGTGVRFRWEDAAEVLRGCGMEVVVAGGLGPETVAEAARVLGAWGVDAVSGVEREPGRKDAERVRGFVRAAREG